MGKKVKIAPTEYVQQFRAEARRLVSMANKRIRRLQQKGYDTPALRELEKDGIATFSVKGKSFNEVQSEYYKMKKFLDNSTSTIKGANEMLKTMADNIGFKYKKISEIQTYAKQFFDLAARIKDYLKQAESAANALNYRKIWTSINEYVQSADLDITDSETDLQEVADFIGSKMVVDAEIQNEELDDWQKYVVENGFADMEEWTIVDED